MTDCSNALRSILSRLKRLGKELTELQTREVRRSSFEDLCVRYSELAQEAGKLLDNTFPTREVRRGDFGYSIGTVRPAAIQDLAGLVTDLMTSIECKLDVPGALPCPKFGGRPCNYFKEINPRRFDVCFAIPFKEPLTCIKACDSLIKWMKSERGIGEERVFRADLHKRSGDFVCKICQAIQESCVVVADITGSNPNVLYELGLAVGFGKSAILIYDKQASKAEIPSDLQAWEYVPYDGMNLSDKEWLEHFSVVFDGTRQRRSRN